MYITVMPWYNHAQVLEKLLDFLYSEIQSENLSFYSFFFFFFLQQICHRDLKLENTLLDGSPAPRLKICDFGYSKVLE